MNKFIGIGRLTKDAEVRRNGDVTVARFTTAIDRRFKKDGEQSADFISCVAFNKTAEFIEKYFSKGSKIAFEGRIQTGSYTNKEGKKVYTTDVVVDNVEFADSKRENSTPASTPSDDGFIAIPDDVDDVIPF